MKPPYDKKLPATEERSLRSVVIRIPAHLNLIEELKAYAANEDDSVNNLVLEGMLRVIDDRRQDKEYMSKLPLQIKAYLGRLARKQLSVTKKHLGLRGEELEAAKSNIEPVEQQARDWQQLLDQIDPPETPES